MLTYFIRFFAAMSFSSLNGKRRKRTEQYAEGAGNDENEEISDVCDPDFIALPRVTYVISGLGPWAKR